MGNGGQNLILNHSFQNDHRPTLVIWEIVGRLQLFVNLNYHQARKRHININFLVRLLLGHPGNVPGTNRGCPRDKVGLSQGQTQVFSLLYTVEAQFVPGTNPVCPWDKPGLSLGQTRFVPGTFRGRRAAERVYVLKVYVPFSFPISGNLFRAYRYRLCNSE